MAAPKLTPAQLEVLHLVAAGKVWRSFGSAVWYATEPEKTARNVSATMGRLSARGLVETSPDGGSRYFDAVLTDAGRELLDALSQEGA